jgi:hypothetical protein
VAKRTQPKTIKLIHLLTLPSEHVAPTLWPGSAKGDKTASNQKKCLCLNFDNRNMIFTRHTRRRRQKCSCSRDGRPPNEAAYFDGAESCGTCRPYQHGRSADILNTKTC